MFSLIDIVCWLSSGVFLAFSGALLVCCACPTASLIDSVRRCTIASRIRQPRAKPSTLTPAPYGGRSFGHTDARYTLLVAASIFHPGGWHSPGVHGDPLSRSAEAWGLPFVIMSIVVLLRHSGIRTHAGQILPRIAAVGVGCAFLRKRRTKTT